MTAGTAFARRTQAPMVAASVAIVVWALGPLFVRGFDVSVPSILFYRMAVATPFMIAVAYIAGNGLSWAGLRIALIPGVLFAGSIITSFESYRRTSIANATLIQALSPALVLMTAGWVFGERRTRRQVVCSLVAFSGIALVVVSGGTHSGASLSGDAIAGLNLLIWTVYFMHMKHVRSTRDLNSWSLVASIFLVSSCVILPWAATSSRDLGSMGTKDWVLCACLVLGPGLLGHGLMTWSQRYLDVTVASLLSLASAPISTIGAWIVYHQRLRPLQLVGSAIVVGSLALIVVETSNGELRPAEPDPVGTEPV